MAALALGVMACGGPPPETSSPATGNGGESGGVDTDLSGSAADPERWPRDFVAGPGTGPALYLNDDPRSPAIGYITEDRKGDGLVLGLSIEDNITLPNLDQVSNGFFLQADKSKQMAQRWVEKLRIRTPSVKQAVGNLSGGNQQKVVIAKWIARNCRVLIFDEPTRGVDIGARAEIYAIIEELAQQGVAILVISSDLPELLGLSDRIMVVHHGRISGEFTRDEATPEKVIRCAFTGETE